MFAIIRTGGKQYKVEKDDILSIEKLPIKAGEDVVFEEVLLVSDDKKTQVGQPLVKGASVVAEVVEQKRDKKVIVFKYKSKTRYKVKGGHRQDLTVVKIKEIKA